MTAVAIEDLEQRTDFVEQFQEAPRQVKISLAKGAAHPLRLPWNAGGKNGRDTVIVLEPGKSVVQPLYKAEVWLGPFTAPERFAKARDEQSRAELKKFWQIEKTRVLNKYDYIRPINHFKDGIAPIGPHRFPDVTVTVLEADGSPNEAIRLHQLYKIGEFDSIEFGQVESADEVRERLEAQMANERATFEKEREADRQRLAKLEGMMAAMLAKGGK